MSHYVSIFIWCNKQAVKIYKVASTEEEMMKLLTDKFGDLSDFELPSETPDYNDPESIAWPAYDTGDLDIVGRFGVHLKFSTTYTEKDRYVEEWNKEYGDGSDSECDCCHRRIIIAKVPKTMSMIEVLDQIHNY